MAPKSSFRIGKVRGDLRGKVWYLTYHENGHRKRPRVSSVLKEAKQVASQINSPLELGAPTLLGFEVLKIDELQTRWLEHHEQVLRSSLQTINRYRTANVHLLRVDGVAILPGVGGGIVVDALIFVNQDFVWYAYYVFVRGLI